MPSRIHLTLRLPLIAEALPVADDLADAVVGLVDLLDQPALDALPCRISHDLGIDAKRLRLGSAHACRLDGRDLIVRGLCLDLDRGVSWKDGRMEFQSGIPVLAELFAMVDPAIDAPIGAILGSIGEEGSMRHAGPVVMTRSGPRWCAADSRCGDEEGDWNHFLGIRPVMFTRLPGWALRRPEGLDARAWADVDREGLRAFVEDECMRRVRGGARALPSPRRATRRAAGAAQGTIDDGTRRTAWAS